MGLWVSLEEVIYKKSVTKEGGAGEIHNTCLQDSHGSDTSQN